MAAKQAAALGRVGRFRNGVIQALKSVVPAAFSELERSTGRLAEADDQMVIASVEHLLRQTANGSNSSVALFTSLRVALARRGVELVGDDPAAWLVQLAPAGSTRSAWDDSTVRATSASFAQAAGVRQTGGQSSTSLWEQAAAVQVVAGPDGWYRVLDAAPVTQPAAQPAPVTQPAAQPAPVPANAPAAGRGPATGPAAKGPAVETSNTAPATATTAADSATATAVVEAAAEPTIEHRTPHIEDLAQEPEPESGTQDGPADSANPVSEKLDDDRPVAHQKESPESETSKTPTETDDDGFDAPIVADGWMDDDPGDVLGLGAAPLVDEIGGFDLDFGDGGFSDDSFASAADDTGLIGSFDADGFQSDGIGEPFAAEPTSSTASAEGATEPFLAIDDAPAASREVGAPTEPLIGRGADALTAAPMATVAATDLAGAANKEPGKARRLAPQAPVRVELFPQTTPGRSGTKKRKPRVSALPPEAFDVPAELVGGELSDERRNQISAALTVPRPIFTSDLVGLGNDVHLVERWQEEQLADGSQVRFIAPKARHRQRGSLIVPVGKLREALEEFKRGWWAEILDRYRGAKLYEVAVVAWRCGAHVVSYHVDENAAVVTFRIRDERGLVGVVVACDDDLAEGGSTRTGVAGALESLLRDPLELIVVLATGDKSLDALVGAIDTDSRQRGWKPPCPVVAARSWEWADGTGPLIEILS